jgi:predicted ferric reductase
MESNLIDQNRTPSGPSIEFLKTPSGLLMVVNFILLFISWCCMADWKGTVSDSQVVMIQDQAGFFLFTTVFPWLLYIAFGIILILQLQHKFDRINWPLTFVVNCCVWAFLLLISSSIVASKATLHRCEEWHCSKLQAAAAFGFFTIIGLIAQAYFHHREFRRAGSTPV